MDFYVIPQNHKNRRPPVERFHLQENDWDDYGFTTSYELTYYDDAADPHVIGYVKIGQFKMTTKQRRPNIPEDFYQLDQDFFSLGQDISYYKNLLELGTIGEEALKSLNDLANDNTLFIKAFKEQVTKKSLLRDVSPAAVRGQFHRVANGEPIRTEYKFEYTSFSALTDTGSPLKLDFEVEPDSGIPTNIHVLIGTNGVGKTMLLNDMAKSLVKKSTKTGEFAFLNEDDPKANFSGVVFVSFSAFDTLEPLPEQKDRSSGVNYAYVGLKKSSKTKEDTYITKGTKTLELEFAASLERIVKSGKGEGWKKIIASLERSVSFQEVEIIKIADIKSIESLKAKARMGFHALSSGHKIILLIITRLIEKLEEKTLVLIDEPESHLHPPLLSALIREISDLLIQKNGVAIVATHSPVVLQEVPGQCVWQLRRSGNITMADRPSNETFGENVGELTRQVFGLETDSTGYHTLLKDAVQEFDNYEEILRHFKRKIGTEGRMLLRGLLAVKNNQNNESTE